jgi:hypothetical protein
MRFQKDSGPLSFAGWMHNWHNNVPAGMVLDVWSSSLHVLPIIPLDFYLWGCLKETVYATEFWDHDCLIKHTGVDPADIRNLPRQVVTVKVSIWCHCEACVQDERTVWTPDVMHIQCTDKCPPHDKNVLKKGTLKHWAKRTTMERIFSPFPLKDWGCLRTGCWGYLDRREMKWQEVSENCIMRNFITCTLLQV